MLERVQRERPGHGLPNSGGSTDLREVLKRRHGQAQPPPQAKQVRLQWTLNLMPRLEIAHVFLRDCPVHAQPKAATLDELFQKTKHKPSIYWLPLTDDQASFGM